MASAIVRSRVLRTIPFESVVDSPRGMVLLLLRDVVQDPREILLAETHNAVASLPVQNFVIYLAVDVVRAAAFELLDKFADRDRWFDADCQMDVSGCPADSMQPCSFCAGNPFSQASIDSLFESWIQQWHAELCVPVEMQEDLVVDVARHS